MGDRAARDLAAARMRGDLPPEVDVVSGGLVNPHVPSFMSTAPWYVAQGSGPTLAHQRLAPAEQDQSLSAMEPLYQRGQKVQHGAQKFRAGACRNCGAMTHGERDCLERPRKLGAWKTGAQIAPDEVLPGVAAANLKLGWDAKRDRFAGFDAAQAVEKAAARFAEAEALRAEHLAREAARAAEEKEAARRARREARAAAKAAGRRGAVKGGGGGEDEATGSEAGGDTGDEGRGGGGEDDATASSFSASSDEEGGGGGGGAGGGGGGGVAGAAAAVESEFRPGGPGAAAPGGAAMVTGWNMRVREDRAKYLLNLDVDSAFYDPKTRSMRENPYAGTGVDPKDVLYAGDNALKMQGDAVALKKAEVFAWEAYNATSEADVHVQANPTQTELLRKQADSRKDAVATLLQQRILDAYGSGGGGGGGAEAPIALPSELRMGASEAYVDYAAEAAAAAAPPPPPPPPKPIARTASGAASSLHGPEDVHPGGHRSAWGSWFDAKNKAWGYACCCALFKDAYCTGEAGRRAAAQSAAMEAGATAGGGGGGGGGGALAAGSKRGREP